MLRWRHVPNFFSFSLILNRPSYFFGSFIQALLSQYREAFTREAFTILELTCNSVLRSGGSELHPFYHKKHRTTKKETIRTATPEYYWSGGANLEFQQSDEITDVPDPIEWRRQLGGLFPLSSVRNRIRKNVPICFRLVMQRVRCGHKGKEK